MEESFGYFRPVMTRENSRCRDSEPVCEDGDGNREKNQKSLLPSIFLEKICEENPQRKQRQYVPQATAGIHHLELNNAQVDDVSFDEYGEAYKH